MIRSLWLRFWPLIKFCMVGVVNTGVYYGVYLLLYRYMPYLAAHLIGWVVSVVASYLLNTYFTYKVKPSWRKLLLYPLSSLPNIIFTSFGVVLLIEVLGVSKELSPLIAGLAAVPFSYLLAKFLLVGRSEEDSTEAEDSIEAPADTGTDASTRG